MNAYVNQDVVGAHAIPTSVGHPHTVAGILPQLTRELEQLLREQTELAQTMRRCLELVARSTGSAFAAVIRYTSDQGMFCLDSLGGVPSSVGDEVKRTLREVVEACFGRCLSVARLVPSQADQAVVTVPLQAPGSPPTALTVIARLTAGDMAGLATIVEYVAAALSQVLASDVVRRLDWEARATAAGLELVSKVQTSESLDQAAFVLVHELKNFFQCGQVVLGLCRRAGTGTQLVAISGLSEFDRNSESAALLCSALDETVVRDELSAWPPLDASDRHALIAHRKLAEQTQEEATLSIPLRTPSGNVLGALLVQGPAAVIRSPANLNAWRAMQPHLATAIETRQKVEPRRLVRWWQQNVRSRTSLSTGKLLAGIALGLGLLAVLPVPHRITCKCLVEPTVRRFVVAPYDGRLAQCLVKPGDLVQEGQTLARMDDRELRWELTGLIAERARAAKERDTHRVDRDTSGAQIAELEMERLHFKIKLLKSRAENLEITAPISGFVLKGDLEDAEGAPIEVGAALFEIAPLDPVKLEIAVAEADVAWVDTKMQVAARLDGCPQQTIRGPIETLHPRAEIRDEKNVFVAQLTLANPAGQLRPGMSGKARVASGMRPLAWVWLHKAWFRLRVFAGW